MILEVNMGDYLCSLYFKEFNDRPLLTGAEEVKLAKKIENGHRELVYLLCHYD
ncbi:hypothetical protein GOV03_04160, partial [Candidatus Woesearchaeota archaeon]|nr:hypothetical protein [Candidatus Woesearchaeota archaeon]